MIKAKLKRGSEMFPTAQIGDEIEVDEAKFDKLQRDGIVERVTTQQLDKAQAAESDRLSLQKQQREGATASNLQQTGRDNPTNRSGK